MDKVLLQLFLLSAISVVQLNANFNVFNQQLYGAIAHSEQDSNILISPLSINVALGLLYLGAEKQTAMELKNALQLKRSSKMLAAVDYADLISDFTKVDNNKDILLRIANRVFVQQDLQLNPTFKSLSTKYFKSEPENINFNENEEAAKRINTWVEEQTANKIQNILGPDEVNNKTMIVLANAIYFHAKWDIPFNKLGTRKRQFFVSRNEEISVDSMSSLRYYNYAKLDDLDARVVEMPYSSTDLSMIIILPNEIDGLAKLESKIGTINFDRILNNLKRTELDFTIPKFRIDFDLDLEKPLAKTGIRDIFTRSADLSSLVTDKQIMVSKIKHKAFIEVDESGTVAGAATVIVGVAVLSGRMPITFNADHPFLFAITNKKEILFVGHVVRP